jgi:FkbM family methyltransferase
MATSELESNRKAVWDFAVLADRFLRRAPAVVVEIGARDCKETLALHDRYPSSHVYAFECNPHTLDECRRRVSGVANVTLIESAVADEDGPLSFFAIDTERTVTSQPDGNPGASSLLEASGEYPIETYIQKKITVTSTRLSTFMTARGLDHIDLIWMDVQGAELQVLKSAGERLRDVGIIHVEVEFFPIYKNQPLFRDVNRYMDAKGFRLLTFTRMDRYAGDAVFVNTALCGVWRRVWLRLRAPFVRPVLIFIGKVRSLLLHHLPKGMRLARRCVERGSEIVWLLCVRVSARSKKKHRVTHGRLDPEN